MSAANAHSEAARCRALHFEDTIRFSHNRGAVPRERSERLNLADLGGIFSDSEGARCRALHFEDVIRFPHIRGAVPRERSERLLET